MSELYRTQPDQLNKARQLNIGHHVWQYAVELGYKPLIMQFVRPYWYMVTETEELILSHRSNTPNMIGEIRIERGHFYSRKPVFAKLRRVLEYVPTVNETRQPEGPISS